MEMLYACARRLWELLFLAVWNENIRRNPELFAFTHEFPFVDTTGRVHSSLWTPVNVGPGNLAFAAQKSPTPSFIGMYSSASGITAGKWTPEPLTPPLHGEKGPQMSHKLCLALSEGTEWRIKRTGEGKYWLMVVSAFHGSAWKLSLLYQGRQSIQDECHGSRTLMMFCKSSVCGDKHLVFPSLVSKRLHTWGKT